MKMMEKRKPGNSGNIKKLTHITTKVQQFLIVIFITVMITTFSINKVTAQTDTRYMRIAKIVVDSAELESYKAALKEGMHDAVSKEPGVISLNAVYDKEHPTLVTVFEIYTSVNAYKQHIQTTHFKKYKQTVEGMVTSLELTDVESIAFESKATQ